MKVLVVIEEGDVKVYADNQDPGLELDIRVMEINEWADEPLSFSGRNPLTPISEVLKHPTGGCGTLGEAAGEHAAVDHLIDWL